MDSDSQESDESDEFNESIDQRKVLSVQNQNSPDLQQEFTNLRSRILKSGDILYYLKLDDQTKVEGIIDTGAQLSCISPACVDHIQRNAKDSIVVKTHKPKPYGQMVYGHEATYKKTARVYYYISGKRCHFDFAIIPKMNSLLILGLAWQYQHKMKLDIDEDLFVVHPNVKNHRDLPEKMKILRYHKVQSNSPFDSTDAQVEHQRIITNDNVMNCNNNVPIIRRNCLMATTQPYEIMPRTFERIDIQCSQTEKEDNVLLEFDPSKAPPGLLLGKHLVNIEDGQTFVYVFNPTKR